MNKHTDSLTKRIKQQEDPNKYNLKIAMELKELKLPEKLFTVKLNCASDTIPEKGIEYYLRMVSILKKCVENPMGIKKIRSIYKRYKKNKVKPPTRFNATYYSTKVLLNCLFENQYLNKNKLGYYASSKAKDLLNSKL